jgi:fatty-acyl-CoA synthase
VIVDTIPLTAVGKIFKPTLRLDSTRRLVERVVHDDLGLRAAQVTVMAGGPRGTRVDVTLPVALAGCRQDVEAALAAYLFETVVSP